MIHATPQYSRKIYFYTFNMIVIVLVGAMVLYTMLTVQDLRDRMIAQTALITIDSHDIVAENPRVCPGDKLQWTLLLTYHDAPMLMEVVRNVTDVDKNIVTNYEQRAAIPVVKSGTDKSETQWDVPDLPPGHYRVITSTTNVRTLSSIDDKLLQYYVSFEIKDNC